MVTARCSLENNILCLLNVNYYQYLCNFEQIYSEEDTPAGEYSFLISNLLLACTTNVMFHAILFM